MIEQIKQAIEESDQSGALFRADVPIGFSGDSVIGLLQRLTALYLPLQDTCYLEIGVYQGLTLLSVANECRDMKCYGIDNFVLDPDQDNLDVVEDGIAKLQLSNIRLINEDYEDALDSLKDIIGNNKIGVYWIDGPHDYRSQLMCLQLALPYLHENAVILIDDSNYQHVRQANRDFLKTNPNWKLLFEAYTPSHPVNMTAEQKANATAGWWNGINVLVRDSENSIPQMYPPTERNRVLFEIEHANHSTQHAELIPEATALMRAMYRINIYRIIKIFLKIISSLFGQRRKWRNRFTRNNTYSDALPRVRYNK